MLIPIFTVHVQDWRIRPGVAIGSAKLGLSDGSIWKRFPRHGAGDRSTEAGEKCFAGRTTIDLRGPLVQGRWVTVISTNDRRFHLPNGLHIGSKDRAMRAAFPNARLRDRSNWDDRSSGMGWISDGGRVTTIYVHRRGHPVESIDTYLSTIAL